MNQWPPGVLRGGLSLDGLLEALPSAQVAGALEGLTGDGYTALSRTRSGATHVFQDTIAGRLAGWAGAGPGGTGKMAGGQVSGSMDRTGFGMLIAAAGTSQTERGFEAAEGSRARPGITSYGRFDRLDNTAGTPGMHASGGALVAGVDVPFGCELERSGGGGWGILV